MVLITKTERKLLDEAGLLHYKKKNQDQNFQVVNREHCSRDKSIYCTEEPEIMTFLCHFDGMNLQRISAKQVQQLIDGGMLSDENMQHYHKFVPNAIAFEDETGAWRIKKVAKLMIYLGIWKANKTK